MVLVWQYSVVKQSSVSLLWEILVRRAGTKLDLGHFQTWRQTLLRHGPGTTCVTWIRVELLTGDARDDGILWRWTWQYRCVVSNSFCLSCVCLSTLTVWYMDSLNVQLGCLCSCKYIFHVCTDGKSQDWVLCVVSTVWILHQHCHTAALW